MKILLASIGTRGDMEPFLAIGEKLVKQGHQITYLFGTIRYTAKKVG
ncbi:MAG: glycosyltransferase [Saprospiraceae bacterium]|nr:glycosyltransferase [Saprospiraceae bacterium]